MSNKYNIKATWYEPEMLEQKVPAYYLQEFEEWISQDIPYDHISDVEQLFRAFHAGYQRGYNAGFF